MTSLVSPRRLTGVAAVVLVLLAGCGEESDTTAAAPESSSSPTSSDSSSAAPGPRKPVCETVWVDGKDLARGYKGCFDGESWVKAERMACESGQVLLTYDDRYYGAAGAFVNDTGGSLAKSADFKKARSSC